MKKNFPSANKNSVSSSVAGFARIGLTFLVFFAIYFSLPTSSNSPSVKFELETADRTETSKNNANPSEESLAPISTWLQPNVQSVLAAIDFDGKLIFSYRWEMDAGLWTKGLQTVTGIATSLTGSISSLEFSLAERKDINLSNWENSSAFIKVKEKILASLLLRDDTILDKSSPLNLVELALESNIPPTGLTTVFYPNDKDGIALYEELKMSSILRNSTDREPFNFREEAYRNARESFGFEDFGLSKRDWGTSDWQYPTLSSPQESVNERISFGEDL